MKSRNCRWIGLLICASSTLLATGCGSSGSPTNGIVQFDDGSPVQSGSIEFRSIAGGSRFASRIEPDGSFLLTDQEGNSSFPPGDYEVVVVQIVLTEDLAAEDHQHGKTVPRRYADYYTSKLRFDNRADREAPILIEITE